MVGVLTTQEPVRLRDKPVLDSPQNMARIQQAVNQVRLTNVAGPAEKGEKKFGFATRISCELEVRCRTRLVRSFAGGWGLRERYSRKSGKAERSC